MVNYTECVRRIYHVFSEDLEKEEFDQGAEQMEASFRMSGEEKKVQKETEEAAEASPEAWMESQIKSQTEPLAEEEKTKEQRAAVENMTEKMQEFDTNELAEMLAVASAGMKPEKEEETQAASEKRENAEKKNAKKEAIEENTKKKETAEKEAAGKEMEAAAEKTEQETGISLEEECGRQKEKLEELLQAISYFDILTAGDLAAEILGSAENQEFKKSMKKAKSALDKFNYEEAVSILKGFGDF
jgi:hypothetical protein